MKNLKKIFSTSGVISFLIVLTLISFSFGTFTIPVAYADCTNQTTIGSVVGGNATFTIPDGACPIVVSFSTYSHEGTIQPFDAQILIENITSTYGPGTYHVGPLALSCNWQADLYGGEVQAHLNHDYGHSNFIAADYVEHQVCAPPATPPPIIPPVVPLVTSSGGGPLVVPPIIHVTKIASPTSLPNGPGLVTYNYAVSNAGAVAMSNITINDNKCSPVNFISGDTNNDSKLDLTEIWNYHCTMTISQTTTNIATVTGQANGSTVTDTANATVVVSVSGVPIFPNTGGISPVAPLLAVTPIVNTPPVAPVVSDISTYGFPKTGFSPFEENSPWNIVIFLGDVIVVLIAFIIIFKKNIYEQNNR